MIQYLIAFFKRPLFCIGVFLIALLGCTETTDCEDLDCDCSIPTSIKLPSVAYRLQKRSSDGTKLAFIVNESAKEFGLLDLRTMQTTFISLKEILPDNVYDEIYCRRIIWSPYNSERILLDCFGSYDSAGTLLLLQNNYIYDFSQPKAIRATPSSFGAHGSKAGFAINGWLKGSDEKADSLLTGVGNIFVPQLDSIFQSSLPSGIYRYLSQSPSTDDYFQTLSDSVDKGKLTSYINQFRFPYTDYMIGNLTPSWSPSGEFIAFSAQNVLPDYQGLRNMEEIWIVNVRSFLINPSQYSVYRMNLQMLFCTYSAWGIHAEFLTDSTLAVSMHKDGNDFSGLWEITTKGKLLRQLTFKN